MYKISHRRLFLFLDYDGTLVPLRETPEEAVPSPPLIDLLAKLSSRDDLRVAVVSGRGLSNLKELLPVESIYLVGCHGGLVREPGGKEYRLHEQINIENLFRLYRSLSSLIQKSRGFLLEWKEISLALHYRQAEASEIKRIEKEFKQLGQELCPGNQWEILSGKQVWEVRPRGVNKGRACLHLLQQWPGAACFYAGDDVTDEDAFQQLSDRGETVLVGNKERSTTAKHCLSRERLMDLLHRLSVLGAEAMVLLSKHTITPYYGPTREGEEPCCRGGEHPTPRLG